MTKCQHRRWEFRIDLLWDNRWYCQYERGYAWKGESASTKRECGLEFTCTSIVRQRIQTVSTAAEQNWRRGNAGGQGQGGKARKTPQQQKSEDKKCIGMDMLRLPMFEFVEMISTENSCLYGDVIYSHRRASRGDTQTAQDRNFA